MPLPAWSALIVQVPEPTNETVEPDTVHTPALAGAALNVTARPELAVPLTMYVAPTLAPAGGVDVKSIVCELADGVETVNDCCTCVAGW